MISSSSARASLIQGLLAMLFCMSASVSSASFMSASLACEYAFQYNAASK